MFQNIIEPNIIECLGAAFARCVFGIGIIEENRIIMNVYIQFELDACVSTLRPYFNVSSRRGYRFRM